MSECYRPAGFTDPKGTMYESRASPNLPMEVERSTTPSAASPSQASAAGYAKGCRWINTTGTSGSMNTVFINIGTTTTASWTPIA